MVVYKLRSPLTAVLLAVVLLGLTGLAIFRVEHSWSIRSEAVLSGSWGDAPGEFGRGTGADGRPRGPQAIAVDPGGLVAVADSLNYRIQVFGRSGVLLESFDLPAGAVPSRTEDERAAVYGRLAPCLDWGYGFQPRPGVASPARPSEEPVAVDGEVTQPLGPPYITDLDLSEGAWHVDGVTGRIDPGTGPDIYCLAGWEGVALATDVTGNLKWTRDLSTSARFNEVRDPYDPLAPVTPASWAGFLLDLDALPGGGLVVTGYELLTDRLVFFVRSLPEVEGEPQDLAAYELVRDGTAKVDDGLPIALEVESVAVGADGLLYLVAAAPPPGEGEEAAPADAGPGLEASPATPFTREVWVFTPAGRGKGRIELEFATYTRNLRLVGVDARGLLYAHIVGNGGPDTVAVFDGGGPPVAMLELPADAEMADAFLGGDRALYVSQATDEGYQVVRCRLEDRSGLVPRWKKRP